MQKQIVIYVLIFILGFTIAFFVSRGTGNSDGITSGLDSSIDTSIEIAEGITLADATAEQIINAYIRSRERVTELEQLHSESTITIEQLQESNRITQAGFENLVRDIETITTGNTIIDEASRAAYTRIKRCIVNVQRLQKIGETE